MDKEIVFDCPCPICGKEIGKRHGILCDDCRSTEIREILTGESLVKTIDEIIRVQIEEKMKELSEKNIDQVEIKIEPIDWKKVMTDHQQLCEEIERRNHEK